MKAYLTYAAILSVAMLLNIGVYAESQTRTAVASASVNISIVIQPVLSVQLINHGPNQKPEVKANSNCPYSVSQETQPDGTTLYTFSAL